MKVIFTCALVTAGVALASAEELARAVGDTDFSAARSTPGIADVPRPTRSIGDYVAGYLSNDGLKRNIGRQTEVDLYERSQGVRGNFR
jgi:hypothetical protein